MTENNSGTRVHRLHGIERVDEYDWLRDPNWREVMRDPTALAQPIRDFLDAENAHTDDTMASTEVLQDTLFEEMRGRTAETLSLIHI